MKRDQVGQVGHGISTALPLWQGVMFDSSNTYKEKIKKLIFREL